MLMPHEIVVRPEKSFRGGRRGRRRTDETWGRTLALFDRFGITKRGNEVRMVLSNEGMAKLSARAAELDVHVSGLAAYMIERWFCSPRATRCRHGHEMTPANTIKEKGGKHRCRECRRAADKIRNAARPDRAHGKKAGGFNTSVHTYRGPK